MRALASCWGGWSGPVRAPAFERKSPPPVDDGCKGGEGRVREGGPGGLRVAVGVGVAGGMLLSPEGVVITRNHQRGGGEGKARQAGPRTRANHRAASPRRLSVCCAGGAAPRGHGPKGIGWAARASGHHTGMPHQSSRLFLRGAVQSMAPPGRAKSATGLRRRRERTTALVWPVWGRVG